MWSLHRLSRWLMPSLAVVIVGFTTEPAAGQSANALHNPYYYSNQTYTYGLNLPQIALPNGQDEVRATDGTSCRSALASNDAYLDFGGLGSQGIGGEINGATVYARIIMPLGEKPRRIDCTRLYDLEIQRLRNELELTRAGLGRGGITSLTSAEAAPGPPVRTASAGPQPRGKTQSWATEGWNTSGWNGANKLGAGPVAPNTALTTASTPSTSVKPAPAVRTAKRPVRSDQPQPPIVRKLAPRDHLLAGFERAQLNQLAAPIEAPTLAADRTAMFSPGFGH